MAAPLLYGVAVAVAVDADGPLAGALLIGPSGCGKSVLALGLIESCPWRRTALVGDDALVESDAEPGVVYAPPPLRGLIEIRGFGPARVRTIGAARLIAAFDLAARAERTPAPQGLSVGGALVPKWPFQVADGGAIRLRAMLRAILSGQIDRAAHDSESNSQPGKA